MSDMAGHPPGLGRSDMLAVLQEARNRVLSGLGTTRDTCESAPCVSCAVGQAVMATFPIMDREKAYPLAEAIREWLRDGASCIISDRHASIDDMDRTLMNGIQRAERWTP